MFGLCLLICCTLFPSLISQDICPSSDTPCSGSCNTRLSRSFDYRQAEAQCTNIKKKIYKGPDEGEEMEYSCRNVLGQISSDYVWSRYKLDDGVVVDDTGKRAKISWGLKFCGGVNQNGEFVAAPCSWLKYAICVTVNQPFDQNYVKRCGNEFYWVTDIGDLTYENAISYCKQYKMKLVTPFLETRRACLREIMKSRSSDAWIDYNITAATEKITPWEMEYCVKVNINNDYRLDRCSQSIPVVCSSYGEISTESTVVTKGSPASVRCRCNNCSTYNLIWTDGMSEWRSGYERGLIKVESRIIGNGAQSSLTVYNVTKDEVYTCKRLDPVTNSVVYRKARFDVYELVTTTHIISYGSSFVMECSFINDQFTGISRVEWIDLKNGDNITRRSQTVKKLTTVESTVQVPYETTSRDVRCSFYTKSRIVPYTGIVRIIVYRIDAVNLQVPKNTPTPITCELKENSNKAIPLKPPNVVKWFRNGVEIPSEYVRGSYKARVDRLVDPGTTRYTCRFYFNTGDFLEKTLSVIGFSFEGRSSETANGTIGTLNCEYSKGGLPQQPLWWEKQGVRLYDNDETAAGEVYQIRGNSENISYYRAWTTLEIVNARKSGTFACCIKIADKTWKEYISLHVYPGKFLSPNITLVETVQTNELIVACNTWSFPPPVIQLYINSKVQEGAVVTDGNMTSYVSRVSRSCDQLPFRCVAVNSEGRYEVSQLSEKHKHCNFFTNISWKIWAVIGGVLLIIVIIITVICCYFCRRTKKLTKEVEYHREIMSNVDGRSMYYSQNLARSRQKMQYDETDDFHYDPVARNKQPFYDDDLLTINGGYSEPLDRASVITGRSGYPKYQRIEQEYNSSSNSSNAAPLFSRARSGDNLFSPTLSSNKRLNSLSYQSLKEDNTNNPGRKFSQPDNNIKMNPYGNIQRLRSADGAEADEVESITSRMRAPDSAPPVAILSPKGWEMAPDHNRDWDLTPTEEEPELITIGAVRAPPPTISRPIPTRGTSLNSVAPTDFSSNTDYKKPWSDKSSSVLDSISVTPLYPVGRPEPGATGGLFAPITSNHPEDRIANCNSPPQSDVISPPPNYRGRTAQNNGFTFDIDDLSTVNLPDDNGMDTLDRRVSNSSNKSMNQLSEKKHGPSRNGIVEEVV